MWRDTCPARKEPRTAPVRAARSRSASASGRPRAAARTGRWWLKPSSSVRPPRSARRRRPTAPRLPPCAQATAIFHTDPAGEAGVELDVWSGNAVTEMTFDGSSILGPAPSRVVMLAADLALARDALARLKRA